jgi:hypothetical protein
MYPHGSIVLNKLCKNVPVMLGIGRIPLSLPGIVELALVRVRLGVAAAAAAGIRLALQGRQNTNHKWPNGKMSNDIVIVRQISNL